MKTDSFKEISFFGILTLILFILVFLIFKPFFTVLFLSAVLSLILNPVYKIVLKIFRNKNLSSLLTVLLGLFCIIFPLILISKQVFHQATSLYQSLLSNNIKETDYIISFIESLVSSFIPDFKFDLLSYFESILDFITSNLKDLLFGTINVLVSTVLVLISSFFLLKDGQKLVDYIVSISPLKDKDDLDLINKIENTVISMTKGVFLIALIQGFLAGLGLFIFDVPDAFLWGTIAGLCAFIPGLGTAIVIIPSVLYLFIIGNIPFAIGLALWGMILVGTIDNFLGPYLYKRGTRLHPLIILFSVLGGVSFFGPEGILLGPVIVSIFIHLGEIIKN